MVGRSSLADVAQGRYNVGKALERRDEVGRPVEWEGTLGKSRAPELGWGGGVGSTATLVNSECADLGLFPGNNYEVEIGYKKNITTVSDRRL